MSKIDDLLAAEAEAAEAAESYSGDNFPLPKGTKVTRGHNRSRTLQIRLNGDEYEQLELLAKVRDLPVSTVARSLLLSALAPSDDTNVLLERLESSVAQLRNRIHQT